MNPFFLHRFDKESGDSLVDVLVAFVADAELDVTALVGEVEREVEQSLAPDELILIVRSSMFETVSDLVRNATEAAPLRQRLSGRSTITLMSYDASGKHDRCVQVLHDGRTSHADLAEIRRRGGTAIFRHHDGFMAANVSFHFENPSKRHTDRFIRLSNILVRQAEIDFLAFCVMPLIPSGVTQVYIDTPSLYAIVAAVNAQRASMGQGPPLRADNFRSYEGFETYRFTKIEESVVLISASSSGGLAGRIRKRGFDADQIVHVLYLGKNPQAFHVAVDLALDKRTNPLGFGGERTLYEKGDCRLCDEGSTAILLEGDQFDIAPPQPEPLTIKATHAPKQLTERMDRLVGAKALTIRLGGRAGRELHYVDVTNLVAHSPFQQRLDYFVSRYVPAGIRHCILADTQSRTFAERIRQTHGSSFEILERDAIEATEFGAALEGEPGTEVQAKAAPPSAVLVAAAVVESGRILLDISRDLRNKVPEAPIIYIVGLAKLASTERQKALRSNLVQTDRPVHHLLETVEEFILPPPSGTDAWQQELDFLRRTHEDWPAECVAALSARHDRLVASSVALSTDLFLPNDGQPFPLRKGFVFWPEDGPDRDYTQADVLFTISSVLQNLRTRDAETSQALQSGWFHQTLLSPENFGRFNDGIIQASFLRAARPAEIDYRNDAELSDQAFRIIRRILTASNRTRGEAAAEFLVAIGSGRLRLAEQDLRKLLDHVPDAVPLVGGLIELCRAICLPTSSSPPA